MNKSVFPEEVEEKILQIIPLPQDATVVMPCYEDPTSEYCPGLFDVREMGGAGFMALCEYKGFRSVSIKAADKYGFSSEAEIVPTVYCPACKTRMFAHARGCTDAQDAIRRDPDQNGHLVYRCPTCGAEHVWERPYPNSFDEKRVIERDWEELEETGWTKPPKEIWRAEA